MYKINTKDEAMRIRATTGLLSQWSITGKTNNLIVH